MFTVESRRMSATLGWRAAGTAKSVKYLRFERISGPSCAISNRITATLKPPKRNRIVPLILSLLNPGTAGNVESEPVGVRTEPRFPRCLHSRNFQSDLKFFGLFCRDSEISLQHYRFSPGYTVRFTNGTMDSWRFERISCILIIRRPYIYMSSRCSSRS